MKKAIAVAAAAVLAFSLAGCGNSVKCEPKRAASNGVSASAVIYSPPRPIIPVRPVIPPRPAAPAPRPVAPKPVTPAQPPTSTKQKDYGTTHPNNTPVYHAPIFLWPWFWGSHNSDNKCK